jgi:uncharacterized protein
MRRDDLLDLNDVLQHPGRRIAVDISTELPNEEDLDIVKPIEGYLEAVSTGNLLILEGKFKTRAVFECARCTSPIEIDIDFDIDEQFPVEGVPSAYSQTDFARVAPEEPYELFDGNQLMVEALMRQALLISLPLQPLCSFGWEGPCPTAAAKEATQPASQGHPAFRSLNDRFADNEDRLS